jgi:hypothetical protein
MQLSNALNSVVVRVTGIGALPPVFESVSPVIGGTGNITFTWSTIPGRQYQVQFKNRLEDATWSDLGPPVTATSVSTTLSDAIGTNPQRFYRVGLLP